jgi:hypothetical protein
MFQMCNISRLNVAPLKTVKGNKSIIMKSVIALSIHLNQVTIVGEWHSMVEHIGEIWLDERRGRTFISDNNTFC